MMRPSSPCLSANAARAAFCAVVLALLSGCGRQPAAVPAAPLEVSTITVKAQDVPVSSEYVAQTQSSQAVNIQARVSGFLDKRIYTEGAAVRTGQLLYQIDPKPFQAQVDAAAADLQRNQASYETAAANLQRVKPLVEQNALSQKDLDDARGQADQAAAAVAQARAQLESAKLDLSYTRITSPVDGVTSYSSVAEGTYVSSQNSQLTTVSVLDPMWVNFSISENEVERIRGNVRKGLLKPPPDDAWQVEIVLSDGKRFPNVGRITFADPSYNAQTGTFMIRATVSNPEGLLRPNQYVRATINGAVRPKAIVIPQRAVQQGAQGHFVWLINKDGKAELRPVVVGDWYRDGWFINEGLQSGDRLVVDGAQRLAAGASVKVLEPPAADASAPASAADAATANRGS